MRIANRDARQYVQRRVAFEGSNLYGTEVGGRYIVYSYGTHWPLFIWSGQWYENADKYSSSTSRHRTYCHPLCGTHKLDAATMVAVAEKGVVEVVTDRITA